MTKKHCYLCNGETNQLYNFHSGKKHKYQLMLCSDCEFLRIDPVPDQKIIDTMYKKHQFSEAQLEREVFSSSFLTSIKKNIIIKPQINKLFKYVKTENKPKLLDIGCSTGWITSVSREVGFDVTGLEANENIAEFGRKKYGLDIIDGYIEDLQTDKKYDVVTMFHVLEHIADPRNMLNHINSLMNDNGKLLIVIPNSNSLGVSLYKRDYNWNVPHHISFFSPRTIKNILSQSGFRTLAIEHQMSPPLFVYSHNRLMNKRKRKGQPYLKLKNYFLSNLLFSPLGLIGQLLSKGEVIAVYGEKM